MNDNSMTMQNLARSASGLAVESNGELSSQMHFKNKFSENDKK